MSMKERRQGRYKKVVQGQSASEKPQVISRKHGKTARALGVGAGFYSPEHTDTIPE